MRAINTPMRTMFRTLVTTLPVVCFIPVAVAQPVTEVWSQTYTGEGASDGHGVVVHNGAVYTAGETTTASGDNDMFLLKYDLGGNLIWERTWGGSSYDIGRVIVPHGNALFVCGVTHSYAYDPAGGIEGDGITVKWSEDGVYDTTNSADGWWTRFSGDAGYWGSDGTGNIAVDGSGNLYAAGSSERGWGNPWGYVEQYDPAGAVQWHQHHGTSGPYHYCNFAGLVLSGNSVYIAGYIDDGSGDKQLIVRKYTTAGVLEWSYTWGGASTDEYGADIAVSGTDIYVVGHVGVSGDPNGTDLLLLKFLDNGTSASFVGSTTLTTTGNDSGQELKLVGGTLYVVGTIDVGGHLDSLLAAYDTDLNPLWDYSWGTAGDDVAFGLAVHEGVMYVAGMENGYTEAYVAAFTKEGAPIPTVSEWGLLGMAVLLVVAGAVVFRTRRTATA